MFQSNDSSGQVQKLEEQLQAERAAKNQMEYKYQ